MTLQCCSISDLCQRKTPPQRVKLFHVVALIIVTCFGNLDLRNHWRGSDRVLQRIRVDLLSSERNILELL